MADNKQYITQVQENGTLLISEDVIATIVAHAVKEVEGVAGLSTKPGSDVMDMIGKKNWGKGMKIVIGEQDELYIDCNINIFFGQSIVTVAQAVQEAVSNALQSTANLTVATVNVNVCGIVRE